MGLFEAVWLKKLIEYLKPQITLQAAEKLQAQKRLNFMGILTLI